MPVLVSLIYCILSALIYQFYWWCWHRRLFGSFILLIYFWFTGLWWYIVITNIKGYIFLLIMGWYDGQCWQSPSRGSSESVASFCTLEFSADISMPLCFFVLTFFFLANKGSHAKGLFLFFLSFFLTNSHFNNYTLGAEVSFACKSLHTRSDFWFVISIPWSFKKFNCPCFGHGQLPRNCPWRLKISLLNQNFQK